MKYLFLDIDGVLVNHAPISRTGRRFTPTTPWHLDYDRNCVKQLNRVIEATDALVVLSSARRINGFKNMERWLWRAGMKASLYDMTPETVKGYRGREIDQWLGRRRESPFVIIDDDDDMHPHMDRLVLTDGGVGLTREKADEAIDILEGSCIVMPRSITGTSDRWSESVGNSTQSTLPLLQ